MTRTTTTWRHRTGQMLFANALCLAALCAVTTGYSHAQESSDSFEFVNANTVAVVRIDLANVDLPGKSPSDSGQQPVQAALLKLQERIDALASLVGDVPLYLQVELPTSPYRFPLTVLVPARAEQDTEALKELLGVEADIQRIGGYWQFQFQAAAVPDTVLSSGRAQVAQGFREALQEADDASVQVLMVPPVHVYRAYSELLTELPKSLGGGPVSLLTEGLKRATLSIEPESLQWKLRIQSASPAAAQALAERLPEMAQSLVTALSDSDQREPQALAALADSIGEAVQTSTSGSQIVVAFDDSQAEQAESQLLDKLLGQLAGPINRQAKMKHFKQIGLALHNYESANRALPPAKPMRDEDGTSGLSWRVHILPYLGESELYQRFALNEPWDSPTNIKLLEEMPDVYSLVSNHWLPAPDVQPGYTCIQAPQGEKTIFGAKKEVTFGHITDGTSNTLFTVEVAPDRAVPWTAPQDFAFDRAAPSKGLATREGGFMAGMADGSVHFLESDLPDETLLRLFEMNDGQVIQW